jgi:hypothetical protein
MLMSVSQLLSQFNFDDPLVPPIVRDSSSLSFTTPLTNSLNFFTDLDSIVKKSQLDEGYDWGTLLKSVDEDGATPDFGRSPPPSNNASPPDKDEAPATPVMYDHDMEPPSAFVRKTEFGADANLPNNLKRKASDLENIFTDAFDFDLAPFQASWLLSPA